MSDCFTEMRDGQQSTANNDNSNILQVFKAKLPVPVEHKETDSDLEKQGLLCSGQALHPESDVLRRAGNSVPLTLNREQNVLMVSSETHGVES